MSSHADVEHDISPDSGHRELSTDSLSTSANTQSDASWHSALAASTTYHHELISRLRDTIISSPTFPIIKSRHDTGSAETSMNDSSILVQLGSPPPRPTPTIQTADVCGRVLRNIAVESSGLVLPADNKSSLSIGDRTLSHNDSQLFVNENSLVEGPNDRMVFSDQQ